MEAVRKQRGLSTNRIEAFSDGVFAVAITLLILEVKVPAIEHGGDLWQALWMLWPKIHAYVVSFAVIGIFWIGHHIMFHYIKRSDRILLFLNTLLLMFISTIPFVAALIGEYRDEPTALAVYGAVLALTGLIFALLWYYASAHHRLVSPTLSPALISLGRKAILLAPSIYIIAIIFSFISPWIAKVIYLIVPLLYLIPSPIDKLVDYSDEE